MIDSTLEGRVALVTGASRGIGAEVALELARRGAHVVALARTQSALEDLDDRIVEATGKPATLMSVDLTKFQDVDKIGPTLYERFGRLDICLPAAATLSILTPAHQLELKDLERAMRLNFTANTRLVRSIDPLLRASDAGRIAFLSSAIMSTPPAYFAAYAASKTALEAFAKSYAGELRQTNIKANIIHLPAVQTALLKSAFPGGYPHKVLQPQDVAAFIADALDPAYTKNGQVLPLTV